MRIRVLGGGWYGCHIASHLIDAGHQVELHEIRDKLFGGASGANPARLHLGFHYPRSHQTRALSQSNYREFMDVYGHLTRGVGVNIYAIADRDSLVDFDNYIQTLRGELEFIVIEKPDEFGLQNVEGAILTGERVCDIDKVRGHFNTRLVNVARLAMDPPDRLSDPAWDWTVDCTFCAVTEVNVDRYEPCLTHVLEGPKDLPDMCVTIMDGPFPSIYATGTNGRATLTSAKYTPLKQCHSFEEAEQVLRDFTGQMVVDHAMVSMDLMAYYWPEARRLYRPGKPPAMFAVRAMPRSGADSRLYEIIRGERCLSIRAGKIDAIFVTARKVQEMIEQ